MTSLRAAFRRLTQPNVLTNAGLTKQDHDVLEIAASAARRELRPVPLRSRETPLFDQSRFETGIDPRAVRPVDDLLDALDLLKGAVVCGTLAGPVEGGA